MGVLMMKRRILLALQFIRHGGADAEMRKEKNNPSSGWLVGGKCNQLAGRGSKGNLMAIQTVSSSWRILLLFFNFFFIPVPVIGCWRFFFLVVVIEMVVVALAVICAKRRATLRCWKQKCDSVDKIPSASSAFRDSFRQRGTETKFYRAQEEDCGMDRETRWPWISHIDFMHFCSLGDSMQHEYSLWLSIIPARSSCP